MTEPIDYDELLSRVLDDEATSAERAQVHADGSLTARLELLRRTRDLMAAPLPELDGQTVDELVARALRELPLEDAAPPPAARDQGQTVAPVPPPASLADRRRRPLPLILSAAAAVLLVVVAVPVLVGLAGNDDDSDQQDTAAVGDEPLAESDATDRADGSAEQITEVAALLRLAEPLDAMEAAPSAEGGEDTEDVAPPTSAQQPAVELGLRPPPAGTDPITWCRSQLVDLHPALGEDDVRGVILVYQGQDAVAFLFDQDGDDLVLVASSQTCEVLAGPAPS